MKVIVGGGSIIIALDLLLRRRRHRCYSLGLVMIVVVATIPHSTAILANTFVATRTLT